MSVVGAAISGDSGDDYLLRGMGTVTCEDGSINERERG